jgi:hypothetical protein
MFRRYSSSRRSNSTCFLPFIKGFSSMIYGNCFGESMTSGSPPQIMFSVEAFALFLGSCSTLTFIFPFDLQLLEFFLR